MSHFTVAVITKGKPTYEMIENALAPYDENKEVVTWTTKQDLIAKTRKEIEDYKNSTYARYLKDKEAYKRDCTNDKHIEYLENEFPKKLKWTDEECYQDAIKWEEEENIAPDGSLRSTYNPKSKWDWFQVGGRWAGRLSVSIDCENCGIGEKSWGWGNENPYEADGLYKRVDSARIKDLVFPNYQKEYDKAKRFWELYIEKQEPITEADKEAIEWVFRKEQYYIDTYKSKETYAECEATFYTYAVIDKYGEWHAKGEMGFWGMSSEDKDSVVNYIKGYKEKVFDSADEDDYITIVDCHI